MQTWLITGASRGLGAALAEAFAARGHRVLACARDAAALDALATRTPGIVPCPIDLADLSALPARIEALLAAHRQIDGLINNAGIGAYRPFLDHDADALRAVIDVNLTAPMLLCRAVLPGMIDRRRGHIVNIASDLARRPLANMAAYVASKHGLAGFSHSLLREARRHGVRVSLVNPGIIDTGFGGAEPGSRDPTGALSPASLANLVLQMVEQPWSVVVDEISVHPLGQAEF